MNTTSNAQGNDDMLLTMSHNAPESEDLLCRYASKRCTNPRTTKRTGGLHMFCEVHRDMANRNQRRLDKRKRQERRQQEAVRAYHEILAAEAAATQAMATVAAAAGALSVPSSPLSTHFFSHHALEPAFVVPGLNSAPASPLSPQLSTSHALQPTFPVPSMHSTPTSPHSPVLSTHAFTEPTLVALRPDGHLPPQTLANHDLEPLESPSGLLDEDIESLCVLFNI